MRELSTSELSLISGGYGECEGDQDESVIVVCGEAPEPPYYPPPYYPPPYYPPPYSPPPTYGGGGGSEPSDPEEPDPCSDAEDVSDNGLDFIFESEMQEGVSNDLHQPTNGSGVTLGAGYDMGGRTAAEVQSDLIAIGVPAATAQVLSGGAGLTGSDAATFISQHSGLVDLTDQQQMDLGRNQIDAYVDAVASAFSDWTLNQNQFDALVSFSYNLGANIFTAESSTSLRAAIAAEDPSALTDAMGLYIYSNGEVVDGLINRRAEEVDLFNEPTDCD